MKVGFIRQAKEPLMTGLICLWRSEAGFWSRRLVWKWDFEIWFCIEDLATHIRNILGTNRLRGCQLHSLGKALWGGHSIRWRRWEVFNAHRKTVKWSSFYSGCFSMYNQPQRDMLWTVLLCVWVQQWNERKRGPRQESDAHTILANFIQQRKCKQGSHSGLTSHWVFGGRPFTQIEVCSGDWGDGLAGRSACCSTRGPESKSPAHT